MTPQQANALLPCLHCAGISLSTEAYSVQPDNFHSAYVECADCGARGPNALTVDGWLSSKEEAVSEAIAAWNRRAPAPTEPAVDRGLEAAAALVERKAAAYDAECGNTDPSTGTREYPGDGASWMIEMEELAEEIRALVTPASPAVPARDHLLKIIAFAYQIAGAHDAPEHILDVLADPEGATAAQVDAMLPYQVGGGPAVPEPAPLAPRRSMSMFATLEDYRAAQASQPTSAEGKDSERLEATSQTTILPTNESKK